MIHTYTIDYDENSVAWIVPIDDPTHRLALTQGTMLNISLVHQDRYRDPPCSHCQRMLPIAPGLGICEACTMVK